MLPLVSLVTGAIEVSMFVVDVVEMVFVVLLSGTDIVDGSLVDVVVGEFKFKLSILSVAEIENIGEEVWFMSFGPGKITTRNMGSLIIFF